jgi:beta-lactamase class A
MTNMLRAGLLLFLVCLSMEAQQAHIAERIRGFPATVSVYAENLKTGRTYSLRGDEPVRTASTIKLPIMIECFAEAAEGKLRLDEMLELLDAEKVQGSGILQDLSGGVKLPLRDMMDLMIVLSDNTATNLILNRIGGDAVNARMAKLGLIQTRVMRKILRGDSQPNGITQEGSKPENKHWGLGRSSPHEMVTLLKMLDRGELVDKNSSAAMHAILKRQRDRDGIYRDREGVDVINKAGALDHLRSDVGIVYGKNGPVAMAITVDDFPQVNWTPDQLALLLISDLSEILVDELNE